MTITEFDRAALIRKLDEIRNAKTLRQMSSENTYCQGVFAGLLMVGAVETAEYFRLMDLALNCWTTRFVEINAETDASAVA